MPEISDKDVPAPSPRDGMALKSGGDSIRLLLKQFLLFLGPGFLMAIAFLDPGNIAADVNQAVASGYDLMWVTGLATIMAWFIQSSCARIGVISGSHLAALVKANYPRPVAGFLCVCIAAAVVATDMLEVVGGGIAIHGLSDGKIPMFGGVLLTCFATFVILSLKWVGSRALEHIMLVLVVMLAITMCVLCGKGSVDIPQMFLGMVYPRLPAGQLSTAIGALGALIMPHNLYLHSALMSSRDEEIVVVGMGRALVFVVIEAAAALLVSFAINMVCIVVFAEGAEAYKGRDLGLATMGDILSKRFGSTYRYVWYLGLLASAQASTLTTTFTSQFILTGYMNIREDSALSLFLARGVTLIPSIVIAVFANRITDGFAGMTNSLNTVNSVVVPFAIQPLIALSTFTLEMWRMGPWAIFMLVMTWICSWVVISLNVYNMVDAGMNTIPQEAGVKVCFFIAVSIYILMTIAFCLSPALITRLYDRMWLRIHACRGRGVGINHSVTVLAMANGSTQSGGRERDKRCSEGSDFADFSNSSGKPRPDAGPPEPPGSTAENAERNAERETFLEDEDRDELDDEDEDGNEHSDNASENAFVVHGDDELGEELPSQSNQSRCDEIELSPFVPLAAAAADAHKQNVNN